MLEAIYYISNLVHLSLWIHVKLHVWILQENVTTPTTLKFRNNIFLFLRNLKIIMTKICRIWLYEPNISKPSHTFLSGNKQKSTIIFFSILRLNRPSNCVNLSKFRLAFADKVKLAKLMTLKESKSNNTFYYIKYLLLV